MNEKIESLVVELSMNPFSPELNFACAVEYQRLNQSASAVSFYLRAAEYGYDNSPEIVYSSLLKMAECFNDQNDRSYTVTNCLLQAIAYLPNRPEAYFLMSVYYEQVKQWQECYTFSQLGIEASKNLLSSLPVNVGYDGEYCLTFHKAVSGWWIGRKEESINLFNYILSIPKILPVYKNAIESNLKGMI